MPSDMVYRKEFGSWGNALLMCGYKIPKPYPSENCKKAVSKAKKGNSGIKASAWKGGRIKCKKTGYISIWNPKKQKYEREHRLIIEKSLDRKLKDYEDVHHINGLKYDNKLENLKVMTKCDHTSLHKKGIKKSTKNKKKCTIKNCEEYTKSKYGLCRKHYKLQWQRVKNNLIKNISNAKVIGNIYENKELL